MEEEQMETITTTGVSMSDCNNVNNKLINILSSDSSNRRKKFKGVVIQQNGHWGAQIYANHSRIWLGTFKTQVEAAMAYDSAAIRVRKGDTHRNFPWTDLTLAEEEPKFQNQFDTATLLNMIKDGSYLSKFADYLRISTEKCTNLEQYMDTTTYADCGGSRDFFCKRLFHKFLTPSDVSKLNRLVIPKKFALLYFPRIPDNDEGDGYGGVGDTELVFYDKSMKSWKFRYCYWKSSQSYVFTRGWNRFVKAKGLKAKDRVIFSLCKCGGNGCHRRRHVIPPLRRIDFVRHHRDLNGEVAAAPPPPPAEKSSSSSPSPSPSPSSKDLLKTNSKSNGSVMKLFGVSIRY